MYIHSDGFKFIVPAAIATVLGLLTSTALGLILLVVTIWIVAFFRNPTPNIPATKNALISPASGKVVAIKNVVPPLSYGFPDKEVTRVSIFLNIFDVHMNRIPCDGVIKKIIYAPGKFINAAFDKASDQNECNTIVLEKNGRKFAITQIAGLIARRIRCDVKENQEVKKGDFYGLIRFGSRVDIYFDEITLPLVNVGDRVTCGESLIAIIPNLDEAVDGQ